MADEFSFLTDSDDETAVENILSQAMDHSLLEQIAAIHCSSFSTSDNLPTDLENRFRKLKSLPTATSAAAAAHRFPTSRSKSFTPKSADDSNSNEPNHAFSNSTAFEHISDLKKPSEKSSHPEELSDGNRDANKRTNPTSRSKPKPKSGDDLNLYERHHASSNSDDFKPISDLKKCTDKSSPSIDDPEDNSDVNRYEKKRTNSRSKPNRDLKSKSRTVSSDSWSLSSPDSESGSESPAGRGIGCLWCSPKKEKMKQGKENRSSSSWGNDYDVEFLKSFSMKEQKKIMKKAMKEEEKINKEAEKIVKWAKQASDRMMDVSGLEDDETRYT